VNRFSPSFTNSVSDFQGHVYTTEPTREPAGERLKASSLLTIDGAMPTWAKRPDRRTEVAGGSSSGLYSVHARDCIALTTAAGCKCRKYRSVVAAFWWPNWA